MSTRAKSHAHVPLPFTFCHQPMTSFHNFFSILFHFRTITSDTNNTTSICPTKFDLSLTIYYDQNENMLRLTIDGSSDLYNQSTIEDLSHRFNILCQQLFSSSTFDLKRQPIYQISLLLPTEQDLIKQFNNQSEIRTRNTVYCIHQAFIEQTMKYPNKLAITLDDQCLTYQQLLTRVEHLSFILINENRVESGDVICQCIDRSIEMIIGMMSIIMCGAIYVPFNSNDPPDRLHSLIQQVNPKLILVNEISYLHFNQNNLTLLNITQIINCSDPLNDIQMEKLSKVKVTRDSICCVVFTSGSTGVPKGVQLRHRNLMDYFNAHSLDENEVVLQLSSCSFDVHLEEIYGALVRGAHLILLHIGGHLDFDYLTNVIQRNDVSFIAPVPSWIDALTSFINLNPHTRNRVKQVRWWFLGGEQLLTSTIRRFLPFIGKKCHVINSYGPAEITLTATFYQINPDEICTMPSIPIGRPLDGYEIYLLDEYGQPVLPGQHGEIVVGGKSKIFKKESVSLMIDDKVLEYLVDIMVEMI